MDDNSQVDLFDGAALALRVLGTVLYSEPNQEQISQLLDETFFDEIPFASARSEVQLGVSCMQTWREGSTDKDIEETTKLLNREWLRLLIGLGEPLAPSWAAYYFEKTPVLYGRKTLDVRRAYEKYGIMAERKYHEPDDHLGLMTQFLGYLAAMQADALRDGDKDVASSLYNEQREFMAANVLPWIPQWQAAMLENTNSDFYKGLTHIMMGVIYEYASLLNISGEAYL